MRRRAFHLILRSDEVKKPACEMEKLQDLLEEFSEFQRGRLDSS